MRLAASLLLVASAVSATSPSSPPPTCCRWTASPTCSPVGEQCTGVHEYLEHKTTTHHFENINADTCLGSDPAKWAVEFDGTTSATTLSNGPAAVTAVPTPLKVTHSADCSGTAPTLSLQLDTVVLGSLTVGGFDVAATLRNLVPFAGCLAPAANWRYTWGGASVEMDAGAVAYGSSVTQTACFEACGSDSSCKQAVYNTASTACYPMNTADASDQDGLGGTNTGWVSILCHPPGYAGQPAPPSSPPPTCCRWTASPTCSPVGEECTGVHEYLELQTTTHHFENIETCLGSDPADWAWQFDGTTSKTTLSNGTAAVTAVPTPLKVTHASDCSGTAPTLSLQLDTVALGSLTVGGFDVAATLVALGATVPSGRRLREQSPHEDRTKKSADFQGSAGVSALGGMSSGRQLSSSACCRWTPNPTCSPVGEECTRLHEYLELKTTTHHFENINADTCLGSDPTDWAWQFDGTTSKTTLSNGPAAVTAVPTPLKVTHAADCSDTAPTLAL